MTGSVARIGFTTVKGLQHRAHERVELDSFGPVGDRLFAFVVGDHVLRTVRYPALIAVAAAYGDELTLRFPDGSRVSGPVSDQERRTVEYWGRDVSAQVQGGPHADVMSAYLGLRVRLVRAAPGEFVYGESVSLVSQGALAALGGRPDPARFRSTFVVDADPQPGERWQLGEALVEVVAPVIRCAVVDADPVTGVSGGSVLRHVAARDSALAFGVDARVVDPGTVRLGDRVARR